MPPAGADDEVLRALGKNIRQLRERDALTVEQLATRSGLSWRGLMYLEHGERNPRLLTLVDLAAALGVDVAALLPATPPSEADPQDPAGHT